MSIISEIEQKFRDETGCRLSANDDFRKVEGELHDFIVKAVSAEEQKQFDVLFGNYTTTVERISVETGMKFGAKIAVELLK